ncbi:regulator of G-protein signaling 9-binding protein [Patella vulgata]|uniref:regulator of G-protein signaling 9-binding protein n=1 Tax=Patella vulgata TaxID=6465 RepID=UPI00217F8348|nr:regulator of G-protein signaling 9-binding protein [Patella vulgata]
MTFRCRLLMQADKKNSRQNDNNQQLMTSVCPDINNKDGQSPKHICSKLVVNLNHEIAIYCQLCVALGCNCDSNDLRLQLLKHREKALDISLKTKDQLLPLYKNDTPQAEDRRDIENLCFIFSGCLELFKIELYKSLSLHRLFPLSSGNVCLINTGLSGTTHCSLSCSTINSSIERERDLLHGIEKDLTCIKNLERDVDQLINVQPWTVEPETTTDNFACYDSSSDDTVSLDIRIDDARNRNRGKCVWIVMVTLGVATVTGSVIGLSIGLS